MRAWTKSACVVFTWSILPIILMAVGMKGSIHLAQANTRTASSTEVILTSTLSVATAPVTATTPTTRYVVQHGDTLSAIAHRFAVYGGWPTLYAANRQAIGPDPNVIHSGTVLVLPGLAAPIHYTVIAGDTLSGIAADFAVRGGWRALYAANRQAIGPDPNVIHSATVLTVPRPATPSRPAPSPAFPRHHPSAPPSGGPNHHPSPLTTRTPTATSMPRRLTALLLAGGLVILAVFFAGSVLAVRRRRQQTAGRTMEAQAGRRRDRGGRSRLFAAAVRPVAAAARVHPVGVAVPSVVLATGIVLFTFVQSAAIPGVAPPGGPGPSSGSAAVPSTGQPGQLALPSSPGLHARSQPAAGSRLPRPCRCRPQYPPPSPGRATQASRACHHACPAAAWCVRSNRCLIRGYGRGGERGGRS